MQLDEDRDAVSFKQFEQNIKRSKLSTNKDEHRELKDVTTFGELSTASLVFEKLKTDAATDFVAAKVAGDGVYVIFCCCPNHFMADVFGMCSRYQERAWFTFPRIRNRT